MARKAKTKKTQDMLWANRKIAQHNKPDIDIRVNQFFFLNIPKKKFFEYKGFEMLIQLLGPLLLNHWTFTFDFHINVAFVLIIRQLVIYLFKWLLVNRAIS